MMLSDAPFFEDVLLQRCLGLLLGLAYAEIGPGDPDDDSVSQWFDLSGWRGVIVVPADRQAAWRAARPNALVIDHGDHAEFWQTAQPFGFIRFAGSRHDAALVGEARPLVVVTTADEDIEGYRCVRQVRTARRTPRYFVRADYAEEFAPLLNRPLAHDEFRMRERQAAALARMLALSESASAKLHADFDLARQRMSQEITRRDREIKARDLEITKYHEAIASRDRDIKTLNQDVQARDQTIMARDRDIAALHQIVAERERELRDLRPRAETLAQLVSTLDWAEAPHPLRVVLPLARLLRKAGSIRP